MSNSNFNITKVTVDPTSQEITNLEINGKAFESGGENVPEVLQSTSTISCDENGNVAPDTEASDAIVSYDTESILPLITNIWIGSSSFSKLDIIDYKLVGSGDYYVYQVSDSGDYPYIKEVD